MKKLLLPLFTIFILAACGDVNAPAENETEPTTENITVFTTVFPLQYFAKRIGGEFVDVQSVYPAGANEHTFEPTQRDMIAIADADLLFYVGLGLEGFIDNAKKTLEGEQVEFVSTADSISDEALETASHSHDEEKEHVHDDHGHEEGHEGHDHNGVDPHVWMSPVLSASLAESIKDALVEASPENSEVFESNFAELQIELEALHLSFQDLSNRLDGGTFFVSHAAFGYIAEPYGFEQVAVAGLNSQDEPSQKELTGIIKQAEEKGIEHIVFEQNVSSNLTEVVQKEIGAEAVMMHNLGVLTQEDIKNGETYFTLMEHNLATLEQVLR